MITTSGLGAEAISGAQYGTSGDSTLYVADTTITTSGTDAYGVFGIIQQTNSQGNVLIETDNVRITTTGVNEFRSYGYGLYGRNQATVGNVNIDARNYTYHGTGHGVYGWRDVGLDGDGRGSVTISVENSDITTTGTSDQGIERRGLLSDGIGAWQLSENSTADDVIDIDVKYTTITTEDMRSRGVNAWSIGPGAIDIDLEDVIIRSNSTETDTTPPHLFDTLSHGVFARNAPYRMSGNTGDIRITTTGGEITTNGTQSYGIYAVHESWVDSTTNALTRDNHGDISITTVRTAINTNGPNSPAIHAEHQGSGNIWIIPEGVDIDTTGLNGYGVSGLHEGTGDIDIDAKGGSITTRGTDSYGIQGRHSGDGNVRITTDGNHTITTTGDNAHGIVGYHHGAEDDRSMAVTVGGSIDAGGADAHGVRMGTLDENGEPERAAGFDEAGYRRQTVTVNGRVRGGTGQGAGVFLAGGGQVHIGPRGTVGADSGIAIRASGGTPKLLVDINLNGRRVAQVIGDGWIINDGGETTIVVNGVLLHDGATGIVLNDDGEPVRAANGAFDVLIREDGVTVDTETDPWTVSERSTGIVIDRDFSADDFDEPAALRFSEEYAPRTAVYESLSDSLLRFNGPGPAGRCRAPPATPAWVQLSAGRASREAARSTVGARYDEDRVEVGVGATMALGEDVAGVFALRRLTGTARVSSPTGSGGIDVSGIGPVLGVHWQGEEGDYALGCLSYTDYDLVVSTGKRGRLGTGVGGNGHALSLEVGRHIAMGETTRLTPRGWMVRSGTAIDGFTDAVGTRVSFPDPDRLIGGFGAEAETVYALDEGEFRLRGSLDVEQIFGGARTTALVSGETVHLEAEQRSELLGVGGVYREGAFSIGAEILLHHAFGSSYRDRTAVVSLGYRW